MKSTGALIGFTLGIALTVAFAMAPLLTGAAVPHWDANQCFAPYQTLIADFARHGELLLWNPWSMGGSPDFAEPQLGTLSPLSVLLGLVTGGGLSGFAVHWMLLWVLAALGVQLLGRSWGVPPAGGAIAGLGYAFSGVVTGHAEHLSVLLSVAALPFVVWRLDRAVLRCDALAALEAGAILGLGGLGGYPGLTVLTACFVALFGVARAVVPLAGSELAARSPRGRWAVLARSLAVVGVVAAVVLAPSYVGFFQEARAQTDRGLGLSLADALSNSLAPGALATLASPYLARLALDVPGLWGDNDVSSASVYVGPLVTVFGVAVVLAEPRNRWRLFLAGVTALALVLSLGHALPVRRWLDELVPGFRLFRHPAMTRVFFVFGLVLLALEGLRPEPVNPGNRNRADAVRFAVALAACAAAVLAFRHAILGAGGAHGPEVRLAEAHYLGVWTTTAALAGLAWRGFLRRRTLLASRLVCLLAFTDAGLNAYLSRPITLETDAGQRRIWRELLAERSSSLTLDSMSRSFAPLIGQGNHNVLVKLPVLKSYSAFTQPWYRAWLEEPVLRAAAVGRARVHFGTSAAFLPADDAAFRRFVERARALDALPLVVEPRPGDGITADGAGVDVAATPASQPLRVELEAYTPRRLSFQVTTPDAGWLLVTDRWAPGWNARVDGAPTEVRRGAFLFRSVRVPRGHVRVDFSYDPSGYPGLLVASWLLLLTAALARTTGIVRARWLERSG